MTQERKLSDLLEHECLDQNPGLLILTLLINTLEQTLNFYRDPVQIWVPIWALPVACT